MTTNTPKQIELAQAWIDMNDHCTCNPVYERDTNAYIHQEDCAFLAFVHINGLLYDLQRFYEALDQICDDPRAGHSVRSLARRTLGRPEVQE